MTAIAMTQDAPTPLRSSFRAMAALLRIYAVQRASRRALTGLLEFEPERLDDLGISVADLRAALNEPHHAGASLHASRAVRARQWSPRRAGSH